MKHIFKSSEPDLKNIISSNKLDIINKNLLYLTHEVDKCVALLKQLKNQTELQTQVDDYYAKESSGIPSESSE